MSWFGLFDRLRLRPPPAAEGWPLPGSQLRLVDRDLSALYRSAILAAGDDWRADMFDIASHHLARARAAADGAFHVEVRLTGRPQGLLFADAAARGLLAWHEASHSAMLRMPGHIGETPLAPADLDLLLTETLPIRSIASLAVWAIDAGEVQALLYRLAPWLTRHTHAIVRLPAAAAADAVAALPGWPARCAALLPCTSAADAEGRGEDPSDILLCLEDLSQKTSAETDARTIRRDSWNDKDRGWRSAAQGGVAMQMPLPDRAVTAGWTLGIQDDIPRSPAGVALSLLQTAPYRAVAGFDYVLDINGAVLMDIAGTICAVPQTGPIVVAPASLRLPDLATAEAKTTAEAMARMGLLHDGMVTAQRPAPIHTVSDRPAFLLGPAISRVGFITEIVPMLEYLLQICEQERLAPDQVEVIAPGVDIALAEAALALAGFPAASLRRATDGVLFRRLLVTTPASHGDRAQRAAAYDAFWARTDRLRHGAVFSSFSRPRPADRFYLIDSSGPSLLNGDAIAAEAARHGFQSLDTARTDLATIATQLAGARALVGTSHALGWSCLARACAIGALHADTDPATPHALLHAAAARGHSVTMAFGSAIGPAASGGFAIDPGRFDTLLDRIEAGLSGAAAQAPLTGAAR